MTVSGLLLFQSSPELIRDWRGQTALVNGLVQLVLVMLCNLDQENLHLLLLSCLKRPLAAFMIVSDPADSNHPE